MIAFLFKRNSLLAVSLLFSALSYAKHTREIQVLISPDQEGFIFGLNNNDGSGIVSDPFADRIVGANYVLNGLIFEKGTISKHQEDFNEDRNGHSLPKEIGTFYCVAAVTADLEFNPAGFPEEGTPAEIVTWVFKFKKRCDDDRNTIVAMGVVNAGEISTEEYGENPVGFEAEDLPVVGTTACNFAVPNTIEEAKAYFAGDFGSILLNVKFKHEIEYQD